MIPTPVAFKGVPGSPYTRKMLAYLRYRRIPYQLLIGQQADAMGLPSPRVDLLPTFYLPNDSGDLEAVVDSTPLIRRFETECEGRTVLPPDPALRFVDYLLEDFGDEWMTKAMFHYRWHYAADIEMAGSVLPFWQAIGQTPEQHAQSKALFSERQISRLYVVGSNDITAPVIEASYERILGILDALLQRQPFLMGARPGASDFAVYAQLTQLTHFDPTPATLALQRAPRVYAWTDIGDDLSGAPAPDDGWLAADEVRETLGALLTEVGRVYAPALLANAQALTAGEKQFSATIDGRPWEQPAFPYQGRCLQWIRSEYAALEPADAERARQVLEGTGCEVLLD
jgi:glutathione S-transferase